MLIAPCLPQVVQTASAKAVCPWASNLIQRLHGFDKVRVSGNWHESMHVLFYLSILFKFLTPYNHDSSKFLFLFQAEWFSSSPATSQTIEMENVQQRLCYQVAATMVHAEHLQCTPWQPAWIITGCKTSVHSNDSHLGADIPLLQTWPARCQALTVSWDSDSRMRRCKSGTFFFLVRRKKNWRKSPAPNCRCKLQNTSRPLEKFEKLKDVKAVGELFSWTKESETYGSARMPRENAPLLEKQLVQTPRALLFGSSCG